MVRQLAGHFRLSPDQLTERQVRDYLMHLREVRKVAKGTFQAHFFGIKFFFVGTLGYDWPLLTTAQLEHRQFFESFFIFLLIFALPSVQCYLVGVAMVSGSVVGSIREEDVR